MASNEENMTADDWLKAHCPLYSNNKKKYLMEYNYYGEDNFERKLSNCTEIPESNLTKRQRIVAAGSCFQNDYKELYD